MQMYNMKKPVIVVILLSIVAAIGLSALDKLGNTRRSIEGLPEPVQTDAIGMVQMTAAGYKIVVSYRYAYDMDVLVAHTKDYFSWDIGDQISPRDLTLIWGKVAQYNSEVDFHWSQMARRTIFALDSSVDTYRLFGGDAEMETCISNNHIIPADDEVRWKLKMVRAGDHIRLKGYLVRVDGIRSDGETFYWDSSTTRNDVGDGACEVIYTTDIEWL